MGRGVGISSRHVSTVVILIALYALSCDVELLAHTGRFGTLVRNARDGDIFQAYALRLKQRDAAGR